MLDRFLRIFADVREGEGRLALILSVNLFLVLVGYYIIKTVREPLILEGGGAELKSYAAAGQAVALMVFVPAYGWFASRVDRMRLVIGVTLFFIVCIELFYVAAWFGVAYLGIIFFIWVGIFNLAIIAQFWSFANDIYSTEKGERLFPLVAVGASAGAAVGAKVASVLFGMGVGAYEMMQVTVGILLVTLVLYAWAGRSLGEQKGIETPLARTGGFGLVLRSPYLRVIALLLILLNLVNSTGEYILASAVTDAAAAAAAADPSIDEKAWIGAFYGNFFFIVNIGSVLLQALFVSRLVRWLGIAGVLFALPLVSLGAYSLVALGVGFEVLRWAKTSENMTDYSVMNTAKAMLWLPTSREEKYKAKQAVDTFFVRLGDVFAASLVFIGTYYGLQSTGFAVVNLVLIVIWCGLAWALYQRYQALSKE